MWDPETGLPIYNAIIWSDIRTIATVDQLLEKVPNQTRNKNYLKPLCGLPLSTYFSAVKLRWLLDNSQEIKTLVKNGKKFMFGTVDTWLIWNLTGGQHITDVTNASRTMLMNLETLEWDPVLKEFFDVPDNVILPTIKSSSEVYGHMKDGALKGVPISGCLGDQQAALVGQNCLQMGQAKCMNFSCEHLTNIFNLLSQINPQKCFSFVTTRHIWNWLFSALLYRSKQS